MDKVVKEETDNQNGESREPDLQTVAEPRVKPQTSGCTPPLAQEGSAPVPRQALHNQEEETHETHSFDWCWNEQNTVYNITCNKARTVESLLMGSSQFKEIARRNKSKELVIVRDGKALSSHFPCSLIKKERLTVKYIKAVDKSQQPVSGSVHRQRKGPSSELVTFNLLTHGSKNVVKIMRNPELRINIEEITVYAYKGEKVKQALKRDGRLLNIVFKKNCALSNKSTEFTTEMSNLVDDLDGKMFKIKLLNKSSPPDSQPSSLDDAYATQNECQKSDSERNQDPPQQSNTTESVNGNTPKKKAELDGKKAAGKVLREIPNSKKMRCDLSSEFQDWMKGSKLQQESRPSRIQSLLRVEYGKSDKTCREVKTMKKLMDLSNSVCQVRINGKAEGSGFLLFDKFVLTNGHVVKYIYNESTRQLNERVTVHFSYESLDQNDPGIAVEEVAGFQYGSDGSGHMHDWALLRIGADQKLPDVLLEGFGFLPKIGGICIIGHPDGGVKKIDPCLVIPTENRNQVVERHRLENPDGVQPYEHRYIGNESIQSIQLVTQRFFEDVKNNEQNRQALNYESCFYFGSSGSPVFDGHCNVVAMHSGGYVYKNVRGGSQSVIEFGYPLSIIVEHIIVQMVDKGMFDVLKQYLACNYEHQQNMMANVKKLVESRNLSSFTNAVNKSAVKNDKNLKTFFEFFSQREASVPMDTD